MMPTGTLTQREIAASLLRDLFKSRDRVAIGEIVAAGRERGVSRRTLYRAGRDLGIHGVHNGPRGGFWEMGGDGE